MEVLNPFGQSKETERLISIYDLDISMRGKACQCVCPFCKGEFEARMGEVRQWHFAHSGTPCDKTLQVVNSEFLLIQQVLLSGKPFFFPGMGKYFDEGSFIIKTAEIVKNNSEMPEAIVVDDKLAIRLELEIDYCVEVVRKKYKELSTLSIDCRMLHGLKTDQITDKILNGISGKRWIYSIKAYKQQLKDQEQQLQTQKLQSQACSDLSFVAPKDDRHEIEDVPIRKKEPYIQPMKTCAICKKIVHRDDISWYPKSRLYVCHECTDKGIVDWRTL